MNKIKKYWSYITTQTEAFTEALKNIKEGDIVIFEKWLPCYIWDRKLKVKNVSYKRFSGYVNSTRGGIKVKLEFSDSGTPNIEGIEVIKIISSDETISKYPNNYLYFATAIIPAAIAAISLVALILFLTL